MTFPNPFAQGGPVAPAQPFVPPQPMAQPQPAPVTPAQPFGSPVPPVAPGADPFGAPAPPPGRAPRIVDLYDWATGHGRLILIAPYKLEVVPDTLNPTPGATKERLTMDMAVLDGGTIHYGGKPEGRPPVPHSQTAEVPVLFEAVYNSNAGIVSACREALRNRLAGTGTWMVLGRIYPGENKKGNPPWLIGRPDLPRERQGEGPTPEEQALARAFLASDAAYPMLARRGGA